jgi:D-arabinose 1-dehydrogenase-like Zn-dependent alcohol dehydrogenase
VDVQAVYYLGNERTILKDVKKPVPAPGQVLIELKAAGVCGSDIHVFRLTEGELKKQPRRRFIPGHEAAGVVEAIGPGVRDVQVGDRVLVYHYTGCYRCRNCLSGFIYRCDRAQAHGRELDGALADFMVTQAGSVVSLPDWMSFGEAAIAACAGGTAFNAVNKLQRFRTIPVVVSGLGPVGLAAALLLGKMGADVIGVDTNGNRRKLAGRLGIERVIDPSLEEVKEVLGEQGCSGAAGVVETSGSAAAQEKICSWIRPGGKGILVGIGHWQPTFTAFEMIRGEVTLQPSKIFPIQTVYDLFDFLFNTGLRLESMVTHRFPLHHVQAGYAAAEQGIGGKVMIEWQD